MPKTKSANPTLAPKPAPKPPVTKTRNTAVHSISWEPRVLKAAKARARKEGLSLSRWVNLEVAKLLKNPSTRAA